MRQCLDDGGQVSKHANREENPSNNESTIYFGHSAPEKLDQIHKLKSGIESVATFILATANWCITECSRPYRICHHDLVHDEYSRPTNE